MIKKTVSFLVVYLVVVAAVIAWVSSFHTKLFFDAAWMILVAIIVGVVGGFFRARGKLRDTNQINNPPRHTVFSFMEHWGTGIGIITLIVSARRLGFVFAPHTGGPSIVPSNLHFIGLFFTLLFGSYFLGDFLAAHEYREMTPNLDDIWNGTIKEYLLRRKWNDTGKYLSSQKSAFLAFAVLGFGMLVTGAIKTANFVWQIPSQVVYRASYAHDILAILFILLLIVHVVIVLAGRSYRRLFYSWFTGRSVNGH
jgi:formate dehydrogenase subunit gamma